MKRRQAGGARRPSEPRRQQSSASKRQDPVQEALADRAFMDGIREAMAETDPPVRLRDIQEQERAQRAGRSV
jgi:hypothetical protein